MNPTISIISVAYNNKAGLEKTIHSVLQQTFTNYELIVVDGGSTDGTKELLESYGNKINYWVSEKDKGIYNAMNKGVVVATGDYLLMLNSGDFLVDEYILQKVVDAKLDSAIVYGNVVWKTDMEMYEGSFPSTLTFKFFLNYSLGHQAAFIRKDVHTIVGLYDEHLRIMSDWKLFVLSMCKFNLSYKHISIPISVCSRDGISCKPESANFIAEEKTSVLQQEFPLFLTDYSLAGDLEGKVNRIKQLLVFRVIGKVNRIISKIINRN